MKGFGCTVTIRKNRIKDKTLYKKVKKGDIKMLVFLPQKNLLLCAFYDKKPVFLLTNTSSTKILKKITQIDNTIYEKQIPECVKLYNDDARGVDLCNFLTLQFRSAHKTKKWWKVIYTYFIELTLANSFIIYKNWHPNYNHKEFVLDIARTLLGNPTKKPISDKFHFPDWIDDEKRV